MDLKELKARKRSDYGHLSEYRTRWSDNDMYSHMNNSIYYFLMDSIVNAYLITHCGSDPSGSSSSSPLIGLVVHSHCNYFSPVGFPALVDLGLRVNKLGKNSVTYEIGIFERDVQEVKAVGEFVHVFVERDGRRPRAEGMGRDLKGGLKKLLCSGDDDDKKKAKL